MKIVCSQFLLFTVIVVVYATNINPEKCIPRPHSACLDDCCERYTKKKSGDSFQNKRKRCKQKCHDSYRIVFKDCKPVGEPEPPPFSGATIIDYPNGFPCNENKVPFSLNHGEWGKDYPVLKKYDDDDQSKCFVRMTPDLISGDGKFNLRGLSMFLEHEFDEENAKYSFEMTAGYRIYGDEPYADGLVFLLHQDADGVNAFGGGGENLGYKDKIMPALAIELDTYYNWKHDMGPNNIHVLSVDGSNTRTTLGEVGPLFLRTGGDGARHGRLWVDYHEDEVIRVYLDSSGNEIKPSEPQLAVPFSLKGLFDGNTVFIGFTAATWSYDDNHDVLDWKMAEA